MHRSARAKVSRLPFSFRSFFLFASLPLQMLFLRAGRKSIARAITPRAKQQRRLLTTTALGTLYETHCLQSLVALLPGLQLEKVGGAGDRGVDLRGWLRLNQLDRATGSNDAVSDESLRVVVQCKSTNAASSKKLGPVVLREVEGVLLRHRYQTEDALEQQEDSISSTDEAPQSISPPPSPRTSASSHPVLAILCSSSGFSRQTALQAMNQVEGNLMLVHLALPGSVPLYDALGLLSSDPAHEHHREAIETEASHIEDSYVNGKTSEEPSSEELLLRRPLSVMLSNSLQRATGPFKGQLTIATQRMLVADAVSERPVLSWRGKQIG
jgi:hypothetical protein